MNNGPDATAVADRQAISDLIYRYCRSVDRLDIPLGHSLWHADGVANYGDYYSGPGAGVMDLICAQHQQMLAHSHQMSNILIELNADRAGSEFYVTATLRYRQAGQLMQITVWSRYIDHWSRRNGSWGLDHRIAIRDFDEIREVNELQQHDTGRRDLTDPSYAVLPSTGFKERLMKAAYIENGQVLVGDMPDPTPAKGQALVRTHSCGMCASEQHFLHSGQNVIDLSRKFGGPYAALDFSRPFVPGHEYVGEVLDYGPGSARTVRPGRRVTSVPVMRQDTGYAVIGFSHTCPGGWGELMLLDETALLEIPSGLDDDMAAMTEPLAVGLEHARRGHPTKDDVALVIGCGAIGLGVIAGLKLLGVAPIIAADFHPARRATAIAMGANIAIDPRDLSPYGAIPDLGNRSASLVYECVGLPGLLSQIISACAFEARIVMGGYCMAPEQFYVFAAQNKRLTIHFAAGEEQQDMELALRSIADGTIDIRPWLSDRIGLSSVANAVAKMSDPMAPIRSVIDPRLI